MKNSAAETSLFALWEKTSKAKKKRHKKMNT
jgi:hypothetical protein